MQSLRLLCTRKESSIELLDKKNPKFCLTFVIDGGSWESPITFTRVTKELYDFVEVGQVYENLIDVAEKLSDED